MTRTAGRRMDKEEVSARPLAVLCCAVLCCLFVSWSSAALCCSFSVGETRRVPPSGLPEMCGVGN
eukprot:333890-Rhodomonas_salina.1